MSTVHHDHLDSAMSDSSSSTCAAAAAGGEQPHQMVRFMCSFGGKILPRPHDNQLRYVGGDTRIVAIPRRPTSFSSLLHKLSKVAGKSSADDITIKYQLPNEDMDALITIAADEDIENMMEEYDRSGAGNNNSSTRARLRLFLFTNDSISRTSSISSLLDGSTKRENWFLDALNGRSGGPTLERGRSEVSSIVSEVPDYLFGLDNSDEQTRGEPKSKSRLNLVDNISNSDPGSPAPAISSPFCSTSSSLAPPLPDLPPVKIKPINSFPKQDIQVEGFMETTEQQQQATGYNGNQVWHHYIPNTHYPNPNLQQHIPVYYVPGSVQPSNVPVHSVPVQAQYSQPFPPPPGQIPVGYNQPIQGMTMVGPHNIPTRVISDNNMNQPVFYRNPYPDMVMPGGEEMSATSSEAKLDRANQSR